MLPEVQAQVTFVPVSQDVFARGGTAKTTGLPEQLPTTVWLVPGPIAGSCLSELTGHEALEPGQTSALSHAFPAARQITPALPGVWTQPPLPHESTVHGL